MRPPRPLWGRSYSTSACGTLCWERAVNEPRSGSCLICGRDPPFQVGRTRRGTWDVPLPGTALPHTCCIVCRSRDLSASISSVKCCQIQADARSGGEALPHTAVLPGFSSLESLHNQPRTPSIRSSGRSAAHQLSTTGTVVALHLHSSVSEPLGAARAEGLPTSFCRKGKGFLPS